MMELQVTDIKYDTDGEVVELPETIHVSVGDVDDVAQLTEMVSDGISDETGFCHKGFKMQLTGEARKQLSEFVCEYLESSGKYPSDAEVEGMVVEYPEYLELLGYSLH